MTGGSGARGSNDAPGGGGGGGGNGNDNNKPKLKKEVTVTKAADQIFKKTTLKISEAESLEGSMRKGGMCLGSGIKQNLPPPFDPVFQSHY